MRSLALLSLVLLLLLVTVFEVAEAFTSTKPKHGLSSNIKLAAFKSVSRTMDKAVHTSKNATFTSALSSTSTPALIQQPGDTIASKKPHGHNSILHNAWHVTNAFVRLSAVMLFIFAQTFHPSRWMAHFKRARTAMFFAATLSFFATSTIATTTAPLLMLMKALAGAFLFRAILVPVLHGMVFSIVSAVVCNNRLGSSVYGWRHLYFAIPWYVSDKLSPDAYIMSITDIMRNLGADSNVVKLAEQHMETRENDFDKQNKDLVHMAHSMGAPVFASAVLGKLNDQDFNNFLTYSGHFRILDDFHDLKEDEADGLFHKNYFLLGKEEETRAIEAVLAEKLDYMEVTKQKIRDPDLVKWMEGWDRLYALERLIKPDVKKQWDEALKLTKIYKNRN